MKEVYSVLRNSCIARTILFSLCLLFVCAGTAMAQPITVKGIVNDPNGGALMGATVLVEGTNRGTITGTDGSYQIDARNGDVLIYSYLGMLDQRVTYAGQTVLDVTMEEDVAKVDDIIVIGYGQTKRGSLTGAISQVKSEDILKAPATNLTSVLAGHVTGMASIQSSGQPGADHADLKIRGSSLAPSYIVDGVPRSINYIDPNEVESISVLKDAASLAVYGLEAQGGVVIVTTKKGLVSRPKITYRGTFGVSLNTGYPEFLDGPGYAYWYNKALELDGEPTIFNEDHVRMMTNGDPSDGWGNTNWIDKTFGVGTNQHHNISMGGGTSSTQYYATIGYLQQKGNIKNFDYDRFNARINLETKVAKNLTFSMGIAGQIGDRKSAGYPSGGTSGSDISESSMPWLSIAEQAAFAHPYLPMYYVAPEGASEQQQSYNGLPIGTINEYGNPINPIAATELSGKNKAHNTNVQSNASLKWNIPGVKGLSAKIMGSYDTNFSNSRSMKTPYYLMAATAPNPATTNITYTRMNEARGIRSITLAESFSQNQRITSQASLEYKNTIGKHRFDGLFLIETREYWSKNLYGEGDGLRFPETAQLDDAVRENQKVSGKHIARQTKAGIVGRLVYEYDDRYVFEVSGREDGSYKFSGNTRGKKWGFFPSASFAWKISNEGFFRDRVNIVDNLKLRLSAGSLGSDNVKEFEYLTKFIYRNGDQVYLGSDAYPTLYASNIANANLSWTREINYNAGIDLTMWKGLLGMELDVFYKYRYGILSSTSSAAYPPSMGGLYPSYSDHNATDTKGLDLKLTHKNNIGEFNYSVTAMVSYAFNRWIRHDGDTPEKPDYQKRAGKQVGMYYGLMADGLFQSEEEINSSPYITGRRPRPGDIKYLDMNGDGRVVPDDDKGWFGRSVYPTWTGSLNIYANWKGFDLNLLFTGGAGNDVRLAGTFANSHEDTTIFTKPFKAGANSPVYLVEGAWRPDNTNAEFPRLSLTSPSNLNGYSSTFWFKDGKYLRLKNFQIGYTLPKAALNWIGIENIRIFIEGSNVFTWSGLPKGFDPEWPSVAMGYYPQQRTFAGGITATF